MRKAAVLLENIFNLYEQATPLGDEELRSDLLSQASELDGPKFAEFVRWFGQERYGISGNDPYAIMQQMHPWQLELVVQKFKKPAHSPMA